MVAFNKQVEGTLAGLGQLIPNVSFENMHRPVVLPKGATHPHPEGDASVSRTDGEIGDRFVEAIQARRVQEWRLSELNTQAPMINNFVPTPINEDTYFIWVAPRNLSNVDGTCRLAMLLGLLKKDLNPTQAVSVMLSLWRALLGEYFQISYLRASNNSRMATVPCSFQELLEYCGTTEDEAFLLAPEMHLQEHMTQMFFVAVFGLSQLILIKQLSDSNYEQYMSKRIQSLQARLGLSQAQADLLSSHGRFCLSVCGHIYNRIGNRLPFRRMAFALMKMFHRGQDQAWRGIATILASMYSNLEITHLVLIQKYIVDMAPAILVSPWARAEAPGVFKAMMRLTLLGEDYRYVRLIYDPAETPELQRSNMPLLAALAQSLALRDMPTFYNYAGGESDQFKLALENIKKDYNNALPIITRTGSRLLASEYEKDDAVIVKGLIQQEATDLTSNIAGLFSAISNTELN